MSKANENKKTRKLIRERSTTENCPFCGCRADGRSGSTYTCTSSHEHHEWEAGEGEQVDTWVNRWVEVDA